MSKKDDNDSDDTCISIFRMMCVCVCVRVVQRGNLPEPGNNQKMKKESEEKRKGKESALERGSCNIQEVHPVSFAFAWLTFMISSFLLSHACLLLSFTSFVFVVRRKENTIGSFKDARDRLPGRG